MPGLAMAAQEYGRIEALTAGRIKSYQLLLERALVLMPQILAGDASARDRVQDILAQVQSGLDLERPPARNLFRAIGIIWDALEHGWKDPAILESAEERIRTLLSIVVDVSRMGD